MMKRERRQKITKRERRLVATPIKKLMFDCWHLQPSCCIHVG